jgi:hypothetical protein
LSELTYITKCRFCQQEFQVSGLKIPIIGEPPEKKHQRLIKAFAEHLIQAHPQEYQQLMGIAGMFVTVLIVRSFDTTDPAILAIENLNRYAVHGITRKNLPPTDEGINKRVLAFAEDDKMWQTAILGDDKPSAEWPSVQSLPGIEQLLIDLRDFLTEQGNWRPDAPPVTAPASSVIAP